MSHVHEWTEAAFATLDRAQRLSSSAQGSLETTAQLLAVDLPSSIRDATAHHQAAVAEQRRVGALLEKSTALCEAKAAAHRSSVADKLDPALARLAAVLRQLQDVQVPSFLVRTATPSRLADFVSHDEIVLLRKNIAVYTANCAKMAGLMDSTAARLAREWQGHAAQVSALSAPYERGAGGAGGAGEPSEVAAVPGGSGEPVAAAILQENDALGAELTHLLHMLTNHYDQCAVAARSPGSARAPDLEVLHGDTLELPAVLKEVRAVHDVILNNERRAAAAADERMSRWAEFGARCRRSSAWSRDFERTRVAALAVVALEFDRVAANGSLAPRGRAVPTYAAVLDELSHHYAQFATVYHTQYLSELHYEQFVYPRKFFKTLDDFVNGQLLALEDDERARRRDWLRKYGDYIPSVFSLPGDASYPSVVQVISEGLDDVSTPAAERDEERLLALIRVVRKGK